MKIAGLYNLGCKVNKYDTDCVAKILSDNGYKIITDLKYANVYVVNTCAVTNESEKKSRQFISKLIKLNPKCKIIVCGCASENNLEQFKNKPNVFSIIGVEGRENVLDFIKTKTVKKHPIKSNYCVLNSPMQNSTRAFLKVQDGCNNFCSYCLIPYLRGRSRSRNLNEVMTEAELLSKTTKEIVVIGIDLSSYKINNKLAFDTLLTSLKNLPVRIRIGSLEVNIITPKFLKNIKTMPNLAPHFHLSLQSGSNNILKKMNRHYTSDEYLQKVGLIKKYFKNANITTDVIVGFPGETEQDFLDTIELAKKAEFGAMHIFPYSKRNGTVASKWPDIDSAEKKDRVKRLTAVAKELKNNFINKNKNIQHKVILEDNEKGYTVGYTENYIKVYIKDVLKNKQGSEVTVKLIENFNEGAIAEII